MCCSGREWKREEKVDHRFDFVDVREFHSNAFGARFGYFFCWLSIFKSFAIFGLDCYTAVGLLVIKNYSQGVQQQNFIAHDITKWIFVGSIGLSVVLICWDWLMAIRIIRSRNISFAFTNLIANRWYAVKGYNYYCLWHKLSDSQHRQDTVSFWVYFSFIGWKRLLLSEGPRQAINALTVFSVLSTRNFSLNIRDYQNITVYQWTILSFMTLSLLIWAFSFARFCIAALLYLPLLCHLQGGLEEFVVRRIDKRIDRIIERARRKRLERYARARAAVEPGHSDSASTKSAKRALSELHRSKSFLVSEKPTLPKFAVDDDELAPPNARFADHKGPMSRSISLNTLSSIDSHASTRKHEYESASAPPMPQLRRIDTLPVYQPPANASRTPSPERRAQYGQLQQQRHPQMQPYGAQSQQQQPQRRPAPPSSIRSAPASHGHGHAQGHGQGQRPGMPGQAPSYHRQESYNYAHQAEFQARRQQQQQQQMRGGSPPRQPRYPPQQQQQQQRPAPGPGYRPSSAPSSGGNGNGVGGPRGPYPTFGPR